MAGDGQRGRYPNWSIGTADALPQYPSGRECRSGQTIRQGSVVFDFDRLIQEDSTGFLGPAASVFFWRPVRVSAGGGVGSGLMIGAGEPVFRDTTVRGFWKVASRGWGITSRICQELRPCSPGRAGDRGRTATNAPSW